MTVGTLRPARFTLEDARRAADVWGANCGPGAIAAVCGLTLEELRPHLGDFEAKRYTNPTLMWDTLRRLNVTWQQVKPLTWPTYGLARIQWEGPWTQPGVPARVAYSHTHWVGAAVRAECTCTDPRPLVEGAHCRRCHRSTHPDVQMIFDINCMCVGGWVSLKEWSTSVVPWLLSVCEPKADGQWHITHRIEVDYAEPQS